MKRSDKKSKKLRNKRSPVTLCWNCGREIYFKREIQIVDDEQWCKRCSRFNERRPS